MTSTKDIQCINRNNPLIWELGQYCPNGFLDILALYDVKEHQKIKI